METPDLTSAEWDAIPGVEAEGRFTIPSEPLPIPNPGSEEARFIGCVCPILDNNHGKWAPIPPDSWYCRTDCPIHRVD